MTAKETRTIIDNIIKECPWTKISNHTWECTKSKLNSSWYVSEKEGIRVILNPWRNELEEDDPFKYLKSSDFEYIGPTYDRISYWMHRIPPSSGIGFPRDVVIWNC